ncbi:MAG: hypothetical protein COU08_04390 [Candidatus Harrisonbacteria bacterium CG10_big_fil_rev_8_21_14_0_10_42_17]|uniref:Peptidase M3A/M3B catalytic domain-containing protein n=1 Tax=Candidatus Harrisonbacteria bacterium CG10_big_fil_rev_8_21_14_0_10_42_17 TaxID=1974584 RepID=A0A2M6WH65_9BACT|nr:MAG: hypothetical protein COU08_04390 [Candidatus Harrisonbacteria bacterium CG10_big_fil_rev_8_21_14_0_10_42_17]
MRRKQYNKSDFLWTQWNAHDINLAVHQYLDTKQKRYADIKALPKEQRTFANTILALEAADYTVVDGVTCVDFLMHVSPKKLVRETAKKAVDFFLEKNTELEFDEGLYRALKEYAVKKEKLSGEHKKLFDDMLRNYRRMGFGLPTRQQNRLKTITKKLNVLSVQFSKTINDYENSITITQQEAKGLPTSYLTNLRKNKRGQYIVTTSYPDFFTFMKYCSNAKEREKLAHVFFQKGGKQNLFLLKKIISLRNERARLLGYKHHGDFQTEIKMAKSAERAFRFVEDLIKKLRTKTREDISLLTQLKRTHTGDQSVKLAYHDLLFYITKHKKETLDLDDTLLREYFPAERVITGMLDLYSKLFSVTFKRVKRFPLWHKDVQLFSIQNKDSKEIIAYFALDLFPRSGKYGHYAAFNVIHGRQAFPRKEYITPVASMIGNFSKPSKQHPSLLSHNEVETFFHEFGHVMHQTLTKACYASQSGSNTARDFVEAPSQMLENWIWDKNILRNLSGHYQNPRKKIPENVLDNLVASRNHMSGYFEMRQLVLALFDLKAHTTNTIQNLPKLFSDLGVKYIGIEITPKTSLFPAGFGHMAGYSAGYYGYMWAKVYAQDMFTCFERSGLLNASTGKEYRTRILEKGSSMDEVLLVTSFLKRSSTNKAFLRSLGL